jgi:hypothetical protein
MNPEIRRVIARDQVRNVAKLLNGKHECSIRVDSSGKVQRVVTIIYDEDLPLERE